MADRGPNQDQMRIGRVDRDDPTYRDASYLGTDQEDEEEVRDLGFIVDDHDDRRGTLQESWQRLDDLDTDEPLETNRSGMIPHEVSMRAAGPPPQAYPTDFNVQNVEAEQQEEDFVQTSMLREDPEMNEGMDDFTDETMHDARGAPLATSILGQVPGVADGLGASVPQDLGSGGFQIEDNPLVETPFDRNLIAGREEGYELDDYDDDKQLEPRERLDLGADRDVHTPGDPALRYLSHERKS